MYQALTANRQRASAPHQLQRATADYKDPLSLHHLKCRCRTCPPPPLQLAEDKQNRNSIPMCIASGTTPCRTVQCCMTRKPKRMARQQRISLNQSSTAPHLKRGDARAFNCYHNGSTMHGRLPEGGGFLRLYQSYRPENIST